MNIQNISSSQSALPARLISIDAPAVAADIPISATPQRPSAEQLKTAVDNINKAMQQSNQSLEFSVDSTTHTPVIKMMDTETGKVIRQFPSEQVLAIAQSIDQYLSEHQGGLLLKQKA
jgi:flagellar protein FlaG